MKKLFTLLLVGLSLFGYAQKFQLLGENGKLSDGDHISVNITVDDLDRFGQFVIAINVENLTNTDLTVNTLRTNMELLEGMEALVCFWLCYESDKFDISAELPANQSEVYELKINPDTCFCYFGLNKFKLEFWTEPGQTDKITIFVNINMQPLGVKESNVARASLSTSPNPAPAGSLIKVLYTLPDKSNHYRLVIRNIMGAELLNMPLNPYEDYTFLDTSPLVSGIYFYSIENKNQTSIAKKLIVK